MTQLAPRERLRPVSKKTCVGCGVEKFVGYFSIGRRICKACVYAKRDLSKELDSARRYRKKHKKVLSARQRDKARAFAAWFDGLKIGACSDCGVVHQPYVMDWDHVRGVKKFTLGVLRRRWSYKNTKKLVLVEIAKCELVCANCHRERTHQRAQEEGLL